MHTEVGRSLQQISDSQNQHAIYKDSIPIPGVGYQSWTIGVGPGKHPLMLATNVGNETRISLCANNICVELYKPTICELIEFHADIKTSQMSATGVNWNLNTPINLYPCNCIIAYTFTHAEMLIKAAACTKAFHNLHYLLPLTCSWEGYFINWSWTYQLAIITCTSQATVPPYAIQYGCICVWARSTDVSLIMICMIV